MIKARIDEVDWVRCGRCGHKLFHIVGDVEEFRCSGMEVKCHSCKEINIFQKDE